MSERYNNWTARRGVAVTGRQAVHVRGFDSSYTKAQVSQGLRDGMQLYGTVIDVEPCLGLKQSQRHAFVVFATAQQVQLAVEHSGAHMAGGSVIIEKETRKVGKPHI